MAQKLRKFAKDWRTVKRVIEKHRQKEALNRASDSEENESDSSKRTTTSTHSRGPNQIPGAPQRDREDYKIIYKYFKEGKTPADVISEHGIDPALVEKEYERFSRTNILRDRDVRCLQALVLHRFGHERVEVGVEDVVLSHYYESFETRLLTYDELSKFMLDAFNLVRRRLGWQKLSSP